MTPTPTPPRRPVPLSDFNLAELRRMIALGHATPSQAAALFGIDRQDAEAICSTDRRRPGPGPEPAGRPGARSSAPGPPNRPPDRGRRS